METRKIYSKNADYQRFEVLKNNRAKRTKMGVFLCEGVRNLNEARKRGWTFESFIFAMDARLSDWARDMIRSVKTEVNYAVKEDLLKELSGKEDTSELMAIIRMRKDDPQAILDHLSDDPVIALFDRPSNHGNLGTIIRSADALGVEALILTGHGVDLYEPAVVTSTMGSFFAVPVLRLSSNREIEDFFRALRDKYEGFQILGSTAHATDMIYDVDLTGPSLILIGNETEGLTQHYRECCDKQVKIPMAEGSCASSFNVGCAATVLFYEAMRQRGLRA